jgi:flagellar motility protein MotE (MotC chaperone)
MNPFEMVVLIVAIVTIGKVLSSRYSGKDQRRTLKGELPAADSSENLRLQSEVARLNDRIRVLERLATDPAKRLSDEIESLKND